MSERQQKDNSGALFKNDKKGNDNAPDMKGKGMVFGKYVDIAVWVKTSAAGQNYWSWSTSEPFKKAEAKTPAKTVDVDDEVPF